jgi:transposase
MGWHPAHLSRDQMAERRLTAARLLRAQQLSQAAIARELGVSRPTVTRWKQTLERSGVRGLRRRRAPGGMSRLSPVQWRQLRGILRRGACRAGFATERWTLPRIAGVIRQTFGVQYHPCSLGRALRAHDWTPQLPVAQARERDEVLIAAWLRQDWPRIKKTLAASAKSSFSSTRQATRSSPGSARRGHRGAIPRSCAA